jgi:hypothetical protein
MHVSQQQQSVSVDWFIGSETGLGFIRSLFVSTACEAVSGMLAITVKLVSTLNHYEDLYNALRGCEGRLEPRFTAQVLAYARAWKEQVLERDNLLALFIYRVCSARLTNVDPAQQAAIKSQIYDKGLRLSVLKFPEDFDLFIGAGFTQADIVKLVGHDVNFTRAEKILNKLYQEELDRLRGMQKD